MVGCGVVGAAIAYELAQVPGLAVTVLDRRSASNWEATGAALGVLMAAISRKKGNSLQMRLASLRRYETLVPELERLTGETIPFNRQGILQLCFAETELSRGAKLAEVRSNQGFQLEILDRAAITAHYPEVSCAYALETNQPPVGAIYSPQDRQVDPVKLTQTLIKAAQHLGVTFHFQTVVQGFIKTSAEANWQVNQIQTNQGELSVDWLVLASGLGSTFLCRELQQPVEVRPVLGQALQLKLQQPLTDRLRPLISGPLISGPVISGLDVHLVPLGLQELWVGSTVEWPLNQQPNLAAQPNPHQLEAVRQQAIALCPALAAATVIRTWSGLRPRPEGRSAPVLGPLPGYRNVLLATGHYRNGVLLAPVTAEKIREMICSQL